MKQLLLFTSLFTVLLATANAASFQISSREFVENSEGEIIQVDSKVLNSKGFLVREADPTLASIRGSKETFTSIQHKLIPASTEIKQALETSSGTIMVEGSILEKKVTSKDNITFFEVKLLVRDVK